MYLQKYLEEKRRLRLYKENLIQYGYDKKSDEGKSLKKAKISVSLHTRLTGDQPEYNIDTEADTENAIMNHLKEEEKTEKRLADKFRV